MLLLVHVRFRPQIAIRPWFTLQSACQMKSLRTEAVTPWPTQRPLGAGKLNTRLSAFQRFASCGGLEEDAVRGLQLELQELAVHLTGSLGGPRLGSREDHGRKGEKAE